MDAKQLIEQSLRNMQTSASCMRQAASRTDDVQIKNILTHTASQAEASVKQMQQIINQL
jgi:F0F1-type ATP synthase membrane subunit b/b'